MSAEIPSNESPTGDVHHCFKTSMRKDLLIILQLGFGFFTVFSAFNSQGFIEISVLRSLSQHDPASGITSNSGYYSLAIIYFVFTICNLLTPPIISVLGSKWAQVLGAICYTSFMIQFLFINAWRLYLFSAVLGFGAAVIWTANGVYLVQFSRLGKMARNSGILWAMLQSSLVAGAIFLLIVLSYGDLFSSYRFIYGAFAVASSFGVVILALLPASPSFTYESLQDPLFDDSIDELDVSAAPVSQLSSRTWSEEFKHTFSLMTTREMMFLSICFLYSGIETTFYTGVYTACLSAATALNGGSEKLIAFAVLSMGAGQISGGLSFGVFPHSNRLNRSQIVILGMILHVTAFFLCFLNLPMEAPLHKTSAVGYIEPSVFVAIEQDTRTSLPVPSRFSNFSSPCRHVPHSTIVLSCFFTGSFFSYASALRVPRFASFLPPMMLNNGRKWNDEQISHKGCAVEYRIPVW
ncbi:hypothetical protein Q1695_001311 [Nippostrongylus brasiliensis]|nr:hypothetical protein Q1695_001311 [Nippostrongylus brasiliensis]